jgi:N-acetyl sugar amidotransferase
MSREYRTCTNCILDTNDDPQITFDAQGVCNYCIEYYSQSKQTVLPPAEREKKLNEILAKIKSDGAGKQYDCVIGISGGVDSTYLAYAAKQMGLRPLVVHYDNGWDSELAVKNIENIVQKLGVDLYTYVNDWEEFKDLQLAFLKASVIDIELITDQAIVAVLYKLARKYNISYILAGNNFATEGVLPQSWYHWKIDVLNIRAIHKRFGKGPLKTYPMVGFFERYYYDKFTKIQTISLLNYLPYSKSEAKKTIMSELAWRDYGGKHYESIFTRFYQAYYLPRKFNVDKRKAHLSTLICSGEITREEALEEMKKPVYDPVKLQEDKVYVLKKLGLTHDEFEEIIHAAPKKHTDYPSYINSHYKYQAMLSKRLGFIKRIFK